MTVTAHELLLTKNPTTKIFVSSLNFLATVV